MARNTYMVKKASGGWDVVRDGDRRATVRTRTKTEAVRRARALTRDAGGGEVLVLGRAGKIADVDTVARPRSAKVTTSGSSRSTASSRRGTRSLRARIAR